MRYIVIFVILAFLLSLYINSYKNKLVKQLINYLELGDFESFDIVINSSKIKFLLLPFQVDYMKLNSYILKKDTKMVLNILDEFNNKRLNVKQKEMVYMMSFNYFVSMEDKKNSRKFLSKIKELNSNGNIVKEADKIYDIYIEKGYKYLDELLEENKHLEGKNKAVNEFLISIMYLNKNDKENSEKYSKLSEEHFKELNKK